MNAATAPHVLFVTEKWGDQAARVPTLCFHMLFGSFESTGFGTYSNFFYDEVPDTQVDEQLILACQRRRPDMIVVSAYMREGYLNNPTGASLEPLYAAGIPMVYVWWDAANPSCMKVCDIVEPICTANVIVDHTSFERGDKYLGLWTPQDPRVFYDPGLQRDLDVTFAGSGNEDRVRFVRHLMHSGISVVAAGGPPGLDRLPLEVFRTVYQRSKITLNFCLSVERREQAKGRLLEAMMCGACIFEQDNRETRRWFEPWVDYVPFTTPEELPGLIRRYLADDELRLAVAASGKRRAQTEYTAARWWEIVLRKCGLWRVEAR